MISEKMAKSLNNQVKEEFFSSYLYLSMASYFEVENWHGFANWMKKQSLEEYGHAMKIFDYLNEVGKKVNLEQLDKPKTEWNTPLEAFEDALKHELHITNKINELAKLADDENDFATANFLQWFVNEQVEEVASVKSIVEKMKFIGDQKSGLLFLDSELGNRK
ncbi:ferritin [Melioribacter sp. OK-6-Me]|uniref:ferritin n=1 Tax=unclassified Melioribacter TaxID=2627329 RepID=UPI003EDAE364